MVKLPVAPLSKPSGSRSSRLMMTGTLALLGLLAAGGLGQHYIHEQGMTNNANQVTWSMQSLAQSLPGYALRAAQGDATGIQGLKQSENTLNQNWGLLNQGGVLGTSTTVSVDAATGGARDQLIIVGNALNDVETNINSLLHNERALLDGPTQNAQISSAVRRASDTARTLATMQSLNATPWQNTVIRLLNDLQREDFQNISYVFNNEMATVANQQAMADLLRSRAKDINALNADVARSVTTTTVKDQFAQLASQVSEISQTADALLLGLPARAQAKTDQSAVMAKTERLRVALNDLSIAQVQSGQANQALYYATWAALLIVLAAGVAFYHFARSMVGDEGLTSKEREDVERITGAVDKLGTELARVAQGDGLINLQARVSARKSDITYGISQTMNHILDTLMKLAHQVERRVMDVNLATKEADKYTNEVVTIVESQQEKLTTAENSAQDMAVQMGRVAMRSSGAQNLAQQSLDTSREGGEVVEDTIRRMNMIRETIQDTSKRIKRLSESSQSIGEVTDLIRDIARQVQVLSMNAAIEAAAAGDAGRNFGVLAQEIQRLAKNSNHAAKKIDDMVVKIQDDAKGAVAAMETSTTEVVEGAKLADNAGAALKKIETVSKQLAAEVQDVARAIESQADSALNVSGSMRVLKEFAEQGLLHTQSASSAVEKVRDIATSLQQAASDLAPSSPPRL